MNDIKILEYKEKVAIYESAEQILNLLSMPCVLIYRDRTNNALNVICSSQPFSDAFDFRLDESEC